MKNGQASTNKEILKTLENRVERVETNNRNDHGRIFEKLDTISNKITEIETTLKVKEKEEDKILTIRMWIIATIIGGISFVINFFWK